MWRQFGFRIGSIQKCSEHAVLLQDKLQLKFYTEAQRVTEAKLLSTLFTTSCMIGLCFVL